MRNFWLCLIFEYPTLKVRRRPCRKCWGPIKLLGKTETTCCWPGPRRCHGTTWFKLCIWYSWPLHPAISSQATIRRHWSSTHVVSVLPNRSKSNICHRFQPYSAIYSYHLVFPGLLSWSNSVHYLHRRHYWYLSQLLYTVPSVRRWRSSVW